MKRLVDLTDVKAIVFECKKCHARVTRSPQGANNVPYSCGECNTAWRSEIMGQDVVAVFVNALHVLRQAQTGIPFSVRLEFDEIAKPKVEV
jgi:predicted Rdx family selenoprotein